ncbi:MAG TPA: hypothetical protein VHO28_05860 [Ignavibacteriales bacterium]|nr:hypothetical protein [Ignavibacteriales bacterium]
MRRFVPVFFYFIVLTALNCSGKEEPLKKKEFIVDSSLVQNKEDFPQYRFSFRPPVKWERLPKEMFDELKNRLKEKYPRERGVIYNPIDLFYNSEDKCMLYITSVNFLSVKSDLYYEYDKVLRSSFGSSDVEYENYLKGNFKIMQYIIHDGARINFKAVFSPGRESLVQFDYLFPNAAFKNEIKAAESSLGTLELME